MYFISTWQKMRGNMYDAGGKVIIHRMPFLASPMSLFLGGLCLLAAIISTTTNYFSGISVPLVWAVSIIEGVAGIIFLAIGLKNRAIRRDHDGLHPKDTLLVFDASAQELRLYKDGSETRLAGFNELNFTIHVDQSGKSTRYEGLVTWQNGKEMICSENTRSQAAETISLLREKLGLPILDL